MSSMMHCQLLLICCVIYSVIWTSSAQPCGPYERPVQCIDFCQKCEYRNRECFHAAVCIPGCDCIPGFLRNKQNQCIPAAFCPGELPGNVCLQEKDSGPCYGSFKRFYFNKWTGQCEEFIYGGCEGNSNNFKSKGECEAACKGQCKSDEKYYEDIPDCKNTCENVNNPKPICPQYFAPRPGCFCAKGLVKRKDGKCVRPENCFPPVRCKSDEEYYEDIPDCKNTCENVNNPRPICPQYFAPRPGCFCARGLVKRKDGKCVRPENCFPPSPPQQCPAGEIPVECIDRCQRCEYKNGGCVQIGVCTPGCNCLPGFLRDCTNKCIPADFCPGAGPGPGTTQQCPPYEYPVECIDRCQRCEYKNGNCSQILICTPGCNCVPGFLRDSTNKCIPADFCPGQCKSDEQFYEDIPDCKNTCENVNNPRPICPQYFAPRPGCFCAKGLVKRKDGKCVRPENCFPPVQCKSDEQFYEDIPDCKNTCENVNNPKPICPQYFAPRPGCFCAKGLVKRKDGKCVRPENCFPPGPPQQCPAGEIPVKCIDRCQRCEYKNGGCVQIGVCTPGCNCLPGFLRDSTNKCIPADFCPGAGPGPGTTQQCPPYEYPVGCIDRCQRCEFKNGNCSQIQVCTPGCNCVPGFLRDSTNKCIPADFCPAPCPTQQCGQYERPVECIDQCQTCEYKNGGCAQPAVCIPGCDCIPGFFRNKQKQCIPAASCPAPEGGSCRSVGGECMRHCGGAINFGRKDCRKGKQCCLLEK